MQGYTIGNYGWKSLQIASVGIFCIDYSLNKFGTEAWLEQTNKWRKAYLHYYKTHGRKLVEWKTEVLKIHAAAVRKTTRLKGTTVKEREAMKVLYFENRIEHMLTNYTEKFWNAKFLEEHLGMTDFTGGALNDEIRAQLEDELKAHLRTQFVLNIFPGIAQTTWLKTLKEDLPWLLKKTQAGLNQKFKLEVLVTGIDERVQLQMAKKDGTSWKWTISPDKKGTIPITRLAFIQAGFPRQIMLLYGDKYLTQEFTFRGGRAKKASSRWPLATAGYANLC